MLLVIDQEGKSAYIPTREFTPNSTVWHQADAVKDMSSGKILKRSKLGFEFDFNAPMSKPLWAHTKFGVAFLGKDKAWLWNIGYQADNGFTLPSKQVLLNYVVV